MLLSKDRDRDKEHDDQRLKIEDCCLFGSLFFFRLFVARQRLR